ncbi:hypothetical protein ACYOEI_29460, partial [Singulisphaera rosea]
HPKGRNDFTLQPNPFDTLLPHAESVRHVARLLDLDVTALAQDGDADGALQSCHALLNAGRSLGDEPIAISQLVRLSIERLTTNAVERVLARGEPSDQALADMQTALSAEALEPLSLHACRGERATLYILFHNLDLGVISLDDRGSPAEPTESFLSNAADLSKRPGNQPPHPHRGGGDRQETLARATSPLGALAA